MQSNYYYAGRKTREHGGNAWETPHRRSEISTQNLDPAIDPGAVYQQRQRATLIYSYSVTVFPAQGWGGSWDYPRNTGSEVGIHLEWDAIPSQHWATHGLFYLLENTTESDSRWFLVHTQLFPHHTYDMHPNNWATFDPRLKRDICIDGKYHKNL